MPCVFLSRPSSVLPCSSRHAYPAQAFPHTYTNAQTNTHTHTDTHTSTLPHTLSDTRKAKDNNSCECVVTSGSHLSHVAHMWRDSFICVKHTIMQVSCHFRVTLESRSTYVTWLTHMWQAYNIASVWSHQGQTGITSHICDMTHSHVTSIQ